MSPRTLAIPPRDRGAARRLTDGVPGASCFAPSLRRVALSRRSSARRKAMPAFTSVISCAFASARRSAARRAKSTSDDGAARLRTRWGQVQYRVDRRRRRDVHDVLRAPRGARLRVEERTARRPQEDAGRRGLLGQERRDVAVGRPGRRRGRGGRARLRWRGRKRERPRAQLERRTQEPRSGPMSRVFDLRRGRYDSPDAVHWVGPWDGSHRPPRRGSRRQRRRNDAAGVSSAHSAPRCERRTTRLRQP